MPSWEKIIPGQIAKYALEAESGQYSIAFCDEKKNKKRPINSARDPLREAQRILGDFVLKSGFLAVVQGASAINLLEILVAQKKQNGGIIFVLERDPGLAKELRALFPDLFHYIILIYPGSKAGIGEALEEIEVENVQGYKSLALQGAVKLDPDYYTGELETFSKSFSSRISDLFTRMEFEPRWIRNSLINAGRLPDARFASDLFRSGRGKRAVLVSSGPGLRQSIGELKKEKNLFIACVDSAYRVLHRNKITPHLIFCLDSQGYTLRHIMALPWGEQNQFPMLYADLVSNPQVVYRWKGPVVFGNTAQYLGERRAVTPGTDFLEEKLNVKVGDIQSGGSVATSLFDLLRLMEFDSITMVGQDLAFTDREIHTTGTHHTDMWLSKNTNRLNSIENINYQVMLKRKIQWVEALNENLTPSDYVLSLYRHWFETALEKMGTPVYVLGDKGAKIRGARRGIPHQAGEAFELLKKQPGVKIKEKIRDMYDEILRQDYEPGLEDTFGFLNRIGRKLILKQKRQKDNFSKDYRSLIEKERKAYWKLLQRKIRIYRERARL